MQRNQLLVMGLVVLAVGVMRWPMIPVILMTGGDHHEIRRKAAEAKVKVQKCMIQTMHTLLAPILEWLATVLSIGGAVINIRQSRWGFAIWAVASIVWIAWGLLGSPIAWGLCLSQLVFLGLNLWGFRAWSRRPPTTE